ncbi:MAG: transaldolase [Candidatus Eremiobacteraeota bacterium]|nr:transaldolase [Candidatus Eremiobacteraeota bacterium]
MRAYRGLYDRVPGFGLSRNAGASRRGLRRELATRSGRCDSRRPVGVVKLDELRVKIFADGADKAGMLEMYRHPAIAGFTTNPTLMHKAGITDFEAFARDVLAAIPDRPISFEVFSDEFDEMERQARRIAAWGENVYVKIPVTDTKGASSAASIERLSSEGIKLNVTALMTAAQVETVSRALASGPSAFVSVFAGRIADSGRDPVPIMRDALSVLRRYPSQELIWASPREVLNVVQADAIGVHVITVTNDLIAKLATLGKDLDEFSLDTVRMFYRDGRAAGFRL